MKTDLCLSNKEIKKLAKLGKDIQRSLSCDINGQGIPCRTDRFTAVEDMIEYLKIHNFKFLGEDQLVEFYKDKEYRKKQQTKLAEELKPLITEESLAKSKHNNSYEEGKK
jgi:hypothetical protein